MVYRPTPTENCPHCGKEFEISRRDYDSGETTFRCPYCYEIVNIDNPNAKEKKLKRATAVPRWW